MRKALREPDQWLVRRLIRHRAEHYDHYTDDEWEKIRDDLPRFAPGMMEAGRTAATMGTEMICLADGRQSHFTAETLLRHAEAKESITIFAFSFDHPLIAQEIIDAVKRGACRARDEPQGRSRREQLAERCGDSAMDDERHSPSPSTGAICVVQPRRLRVEACVPAVWTDYR